MMDAAAGARPSLPWLLLAGTVWVLDRVTKRLVVATLELGQEVPVFDFFSWVRLHNEGAAFSFLDGAGGWQRWFFVALAVAFSVFLIVELRRLEPGNWLLGLAYSLILGGALGNLYDRLFDGYVVDFVLVYWREYYFPAFNVADSAISVGAVLWIWSMIRERRNSPSPA